MEYNGLVTPLIVIDSDGIAPSLEATYGPYNSIDEAYDTLVSELEAEFIPIGLTVGIKINNTIKEYWFNGGTAKSNLVEKVSGSASGGVAIESIATSDIEKLFK